jgi:hypothetical protein
MSCREDFRFPFRGDRTQEQVLSLGQTQHFDTKISLCYLKKLNAQYAAEKEAKCGELFA